MTQKKKPVLRFKGFTDDWEQRKLGEMLEFRNGFNGSSEIYGGDTPLISVMDILNNNFITHDKILAHVCVDNNIKERFKISYGDVLFQRSSENYEDAGTSNVYIDRQNNAIFGGFVIAGKKLKEYDPICFKYLLDSKYVRNQIIRKAQGAQHINVSQDTLQNVAIYIPNMEEQNKIGAYLHNIDHLITLHQRKYEKLRNLKKFFLEKIFPQNGKRVPEVRFAGFTGDWEQRKIFELFKITRGHVLASPLISDTKTGDKPYPVFSSQTKNNGLMGYYKDYLYQDAITWTTDGANAGTVNYRAEKFYCTNVCGVLLADKVIPNQMIAEALNKVAKRHVSYVGNPKLMNNVMADIEITLPDDENEQKRISYLFDKIDNLITLHQRKLEKLQNLKKAALDKMFV